MSCDRFTKPIIGSSVKITVPTSSSSLNDLSVTIDPDTRRIIIDIEGDPTVPLIVGRYWEDQSVPTSTEGKAIQSGSQIQLTLAQAVGLRMIALGSAFDAQLTQYESELLV